MERINLAKHRWFEIKSILEKALENNLSREAFINEIINVLRVLGWLLSGGFIWKIEDEFKRPYLILNKRTTYDGCLDLSIVISIERGDLLQYMKKEKINVGIYIKEKIEVCCLLSDNDSKETTIWSIPLINKEKDKNKYYDEIGQKLCVWLHFNQYNKDIFLNGLKKEYANQQEIIRQKRIIEDAFNSPNETIKEILRAKYKAENLNEDVIEEMLPRYTINIGKADLNL